MYEKSTSIYHGSNGTILSLFPEFEGRPAITTPYDCSLETAMDRSRQTDITESVKSFESQTWLLIGSFILTLAFLINVHLRMNRIKSFSPSNSGLWSIFSFIFKNPTIKEINSNSRLIIYTLLIAVFFLRIGYFENLLKCDQVATYQPHVYSSFEELSSDPDAKIISWEEPLEIMKSQPRGSIYRTIFETVVRSGFETKPGTDEMMQFLMDRRTASNKALICDIPRISDMACDVIRTLRRDGGNTTAMEGLCFHEYIPDLDSPEKEFHDKYLSYPVARHISYNFTQKKIFAKWHKLFKRKFEMFLIQSYSPISGTIQGPPITPGIADCVAQKLPVTHNPDPAPFKLFYFRNALFALIISFSLAVITLIVEHIFVKLFPMKPVIRKRRRIPMELIKQHFPEYYEDLQWKQFHARQRATRDDIVSQPMEQVQEEKQVPKKKVSFKSVVVVAEINQQVPCHSRQTCETVLAEVHRCDSLPPVEI